MTGVLITGILEIWSFSAANTLLNIILTPVTASPNHPQQAPLRSTIEDTASTHKCT
jgi:hypothetical protein